MLFSLYEGESVETALELHLGVIDLRSANAIWLLLLNKQIPIKVLDELLSKAAQDRLSPMLRLDADHAWLEECRLIFHNGAWIFCHSKRIDAYAYHGADSLALARIIKGCGGSVLDMCAGVGAQGISLALAGADVVCAEINPRCRDLFWLNAEINGMIDRVKFEAASPKEVEGCFDWIVCNPPLLPVPPGLEFPFVGNGGPDGLSVFKSLLENAPRLLSERGKIRFVCTALGSDAGPDVSELNSVAKHNALSMDIIVPCRTALEPGEPMFEALVQTAMMSGASEARARREYTSHFKSMPYLYSMVGTAFRSNRSVVVNTTQHYHLNRSFWHL